MKKLIMQKDGSSEIVDLTTAEVEKRKASEAAHLEHEKKFGYIAKRRDAYPNSGEQLDVAYKDRIARQLAAGKARKALSSGDKDSAISILINAMDAGEDADKVDGEITRVKRKFPKK